MQNFGNYNVNPNTPIYVGGGKKKVKKQSEDKSLGEKSRYWRSFNSWSDRSYPYWVWNY